MSDRQRVAVVFDGSFAGFLCVVYAYYYDGIEPLSINEEGQYQRSLYAEEFFVDTDEKRAARVEQGIRTKISSDALGTLECAFLEGEQDKFMDMFRYVLFGFKVGASVDEHLQQDCVLRVQKFARLVGREAHKLTGFCRFSEIKVAGDAGKDPGTTQLSSQTSDDGLYYCVIGPKHHVLGMLAEHFKDRMRGQAWIIHDTKRRLAAVFDGRDYIIIDAPARLNVQLAEGEEEWRQLWMQFFKTITIEERKNPRLQRQMVPLYFRKYMTEFQV